MDRREGETSLQSLLQSKAKRKTEEALVLNSRLQIELVTASMCSVCMSGCFVPLWNFRRIHSPRTPIPEEVEVIETLDGEMFAVPAGREFLCRMDILGVPGVLDGLSHVVSEGVGKKSNDVSRAVAAVIFVILFTVLELFVGNNYKKGSHQRMQNWHLWSSAGKLENWN